MKRIITVLLSLFIILSLTGCGGGSGGSRKPSGLYRDDPEELLSHPDDNMLWKSDVIEDGQGRVWEYQLEGDRLDLTNREDDSCWVCKIDFIDGTNVYDIYDYASESDMLCPFWNTYYSTSYKGGSNSTSSNNNNQKDDKETNKPEASTKTDVSVYQLDSSLLKYEITTIREYINDSNLLALINNSTDIDYSERGLLLDELISYILDSFGSKADEKCIIINGAYSDLLKAETESINENNKDQYAIEFPSEINGYPVLFIDLSFESWLGYQIINDDTIIIVPEGVLLDYIGRREKNLKVLSSTELLSFDTSERYYCDISKASNLEVFYGGLNYLSTIPKSLWFGDFTIHKDTIYNGNGNIEINDNTRFFGLRIKDLNNVNDSMDNIKHLSINSRVFNVYLRHVGKFEVGSNVTDYNFGFESVDEFVMHDAKIYDRSNNQWISSVKDIYLYGTYYISDDDSMWDYSGFLRLGDCAGLIIHNLTGQEINWSKFLQRPDKVEEDKWVSNKTFETGRIDMGKYPIDVVNN